MKFPTHGGLTIDAWRQDLESFDAGASDVIAMNAFKVASQHMASHPDKPEFLPTLAGIAAVYAVNSIAASAVLIDGPLPFGDYIGFALWMIPDAKIHGYVYDLFD